MGGIGQTEKTIKVPQTGASSCLVGGIDGVPSGVVYVLDAMKVLESLGEPNRSQRNPIVNEDNEGVVVAFEYHMY
jgi:hypothetical protein